MQHSPAIVQDWPSGLQIGGPQTLLLQSPVQHSPPDVQGPPSGVHITHENLFDNSNEGIAVANKPIFSVQYHPEASPGPHDASYLFARFRDELKRGK